MTHIPVLLEETIAVLNPKPNENFIDCTFGRGGHTRVLLEKTAPNGIVIGLDLDAQSLESYRAENIVDARLVLENINFADIDRSEAIKRVSPINGILYDLGMSSWHIDDSKKGFAFSKDEALDMRYDQNDSVTAASLVNSAPAAELEKIFSEYGQERHARKIAKAIETARRQKKIETAGHLALIVSRVITPAQKNASLARIFQALRIAVNRELENVERGLAAGFEIVSPGGRMAVIAFHSLEDRIVKLKFRELVAQGRARLVLEKPAAPTESEVASNPRSRSAKLRAIEKIK